VIARIVSVCLVTLGTSSSLPASAADPAKDEPPSRAVYEAEISRGFAHVRKIQGPERVLNPESVGALYLAVAGKDLRVVGDISDRSVGFVLAEVNNALGERAMRETIPAALARSCSLDATKSGSCYPLSKFRTKAPPNTSSERTRDR